MIKRFQRGLLGSVCALVVASCSSPTVQLTTRQTAAAPRRVIVELYDTDETASAPLGRTDGAAPAPWIALLGQYITVDRDLGCAVPSLTDGRRRRLIGGTLQPTWAFDDLRNFARSDKATERIAGVFTDPTLDLGDPDPEPGHDYTAAGVKKLLNVEALHRRYGNGEGVLLAVVDSGVRHTGAFRFDSSLGWSFSPSSHPVGAAVARSHANMVVYDALLSAPGATIADYVIGSSATSRVAACALSQLRAQLASTPPPSYKAVVVVNAWGLAHDAAAEPLPNASPDCVPGDPRLFSDNVHQNPCHPLFRAVGALALTTDVVFAAGNDPTPLSPQMKCTSTTGSVRGPNSHPLVLTVGAVNLDGEYLGTSVGPGEWATAKPDLVGIAGFLGSGVFGPQSNDNDSSAAAGVVAGVVTAMRSIDLGQTPAELRETLIKSAEPLTAAEWDCRFGAGRIQVPTPSSLTAETSSGNQRRSPSRRHEPTRGLFRP